MRHFSNEEWFQTDLRQVCGFLKRTNDRMKLKTYIEENQEVFSNLPEDAYDFLTVMAGIRNLRLIKQEVQRVENVHLGASGPVQKRRFKPDKAFHHRRHHKRAGEQPGSGCDDLSDR